MSDTVNAKNKRQHASKSAYYKLQFGRTEANKKRKRAKHLRNNPRDVYNAENYEAAYGRSAFLWRIGA